MDAEWREKGEKGENEKTVIYRDIFTRRRIIFLGVFKYREGEHKQLEVRHQK